MKKIYSILFLFGIYQLSAQNLTNGSVFNYSIGDTIVTLKTQNSAGSISQPTTTHYQIFTGKVVTPGQDSIIYTTKDIFYTAPTCMTCQPLIVSSTASFTVTNLGASAVAFTIANVNPCLQVKDEVDVPVCGKTSYHKYTDATSACFEPTTHDYKIIEGIGILYSTTIGNSNPPGMGWTTVLMSFHKVGEPSCGTIGPIPTNIPVNTSKVEDISIYPNPSNGIITINKGQFQKLKILIQNLAGQTVLEYEDSSDKIKLDLKLPAGVYFCEIRNEENRQVLKEKLILATY